MAFTQQDVIPQKLLSITEGVVPMNMKKSLIAVAVAGACTVPMAAAQAAEVYGAVNVQLESVSVGDAGKTGLIFSTPEKEEAPAMADVFETRLGVTGSADLGGGLTANYTFEVGIGTSAFDDPGGSVEEDADFETRLTWVGLSGDFGSVRAGTMWSALYAYLGWNFFRTCCHGGAPYYYITSGLESNAYGLRIDSAVQYTYGGGGYSSDPFTFTVELNMEDETDSAIDEEFLDAITVAASTTFAGVTLDVLHTSETETQPATGSAPEPSLTGFGVEWGAGNFWIGGNYIIFDSGTDVDDPEATAMMLKAEYSFGNGFKIGAGIGSGDGGDIKPDMSSIFLHAEKNLGAGTVLYAGYESAETETDAGTVGEDSVFHVGIRHSF